MRAAYPRTESPTAEAATAAFLPDAEPVALPDVDAVLAAVAAGEVDRGVVVLEDSVTGTARVVVDELVFGASPLFVVGEDLRAVPATDPPVTRRHVALAAAPVPATPGAQTLLFVVPGFNRPGTLLEVLAAFSSRGVNLTSIESRPLAGSIGMYGFLVEFEGSPADDVAVEALADVLAAAGTVKFLGTFPAGPRSWGQVTGREVTGALLRSVADVTALGERLAP